MFKDIPPPSDSAWQGVVMGLNKICMFLFIYLAVYKQDSNSYRYVLIRIFSLLVHRSTKFYFCLNRFTNLTITGRSSATSVSIYNVTASKMCSSMDSPVLSLIISAVPCAGCTPSQEHKAVTWAKLEPADVISVPTN